MVLSRFSRVGFIGLGAMGKHMVARLAQNLPESTRISVFDVAKPPMEELSTKYPNKIISCASPRHVAENSVCCLCFTSMWYRALKEEASKLIDVAAIHPFYGTGRRSREVCLPGWEDRRHQRQS